MLCDVEIGRATKIAEQIKMRKREMANDYLILCPENGGFLDALNFIFLSRREHRFIGYGDHLWHQADTVDRQWIITVSILIRKFLRLVEKPMSLVGFYIKFILNMLSLSGGIPTIICKVLKVPNISLGFSTNKKTILMLS